MRNGTVIIRLLGAVTAALAWGCATAPGHIPDPLNVPLLSKRGETRVSGNLGYMGSGVQVQAATAVTGRMALLGAAAYAQESNCFTCTTNIRRHGELGAGWFAPTETGLTREVFAGAGIGRFRVLGESGKFDPSNEDLFITSGNYQQLFLQGNVGRNGKFLDRAAALRLSAFRYTDFEKFNGDGVPQSVARNHLGFYAEPALILRFGFKHIKAESQIGLSLPLYQPKGLDNEIVWVGLGLSLDAFGR